MFINASSANIQVPAVSIVPVAEAAVTPSTLKIGNTVELAVKSYFKDEPLMIDIARCESTFVQNNADGSIRRGRVNQSDIGVMQINEYYHAKTAKALGYDLYTIEGNMGYARYLYDTQGSQPWISSSPCWGKANPSAQIAQK